MPGLNEADTCRRYVLPKIRDAGWEVEPHCINEQLTFTDGRIVSIGGRDRRRPVKRADYIFRYRSEMAVAVVEAKPEDDGPDVGMQQAKEYAEMLGLRLAYSTNGHRIMEFDFTSGRETEVSGFPKPEEVWSRLCAAGDVVPDHAERLLMPYHKQSGKSPRYYQDVAISRVLRAILDGKKRVLLTMATGSGKTVVAFQVCWKLWSSRWNRDGASRRPRILYLSDRNVLIDDPKDKDFAPFGDARWKIEGGVANKSREMYFAIYQALARDERRPGLYREYAPDFFDLVIVDECHRGSATEESNWREILEYFEPAFQIGMTATPQHEDNRDTYRYFGAPVYQYSLRQGIDDGFLAPYRVHRIVTEWDATGWRPSRGDLDRYGREIPDGEYHTADFERRVALRARTEAVARHLSTHMASTDRFAKTIVFCVDQDHASEMRRALNNANSDLVQKHSDYVCRVTAEEHDVGRGHLSRFQDLERDTPVILTTSQMLTTGVDAPTVKNVVLVRVINSMVDFKQIIGRGTRVRDDYGKTHFSIFDYTGSATRLFADPAFDGDPVIETQLNIDREGRQVANEEVVKPEDDEPVQYGDGPETRRVADGQHEAARKFYFDGDHVEIVSHVVSELDPDGRKLRVVQLTDYSAEKVRSLFRNAADLRERWMNPVQRKEVIARLSERGIEFADLAVASRQPEADPLDLLCHLAFSAPLRTRRERARRLKAKKKDLFEQYGAEGQQILNELLDKYTEFGEAQFTLPDVLEVAPISDHGTVVEISRFFGGERKLIAAVDALQAALYAA